MKMRAFAFCLILTALTGPANALDLTLPANARQTVQRDSTLDSYGAPIAGFKDGALQTLKFEGQVRRSAWRIGAQGLTTLQVLAPLRAQLEEAGFRLVLECDQISCGGFDFRFNTEVLQAPNMVVNLRAFRALVALKGPESAPDQVVSLLVSSGPQASHLQIIQAGRLDDSISITAQAGAQINPPMAGGGTGNDAVTAPSSVDSMLLATGSVVLSGLDFATGTSDLGEGPFVALQKLAGLMAQREDIRVALVGHTDSVGGLANNIALSKRRANSVRQRLIERYGIAPDRLDAEGMGYLSPVASHLDAAGRDANRRVEAILLPR